MGHPIKLYIALLSLMYTSASCYKDADLTGMFISDESVNQRFEQSVAWNALHPARDILVPRDHYQILSMGDSHVGGSRNLTIFLDSAITSETVAMVMVGDLTTGHEKDYNVFKQRLPVQDVLPSFQIVGNHDLYFGGWKHYYAAFGSSTYVFRVSTPVAKDLFICLDTGGGTLGNKQLEWFKHTLQHVRPGYRRCIVFTHNNLFRFRRTSSTNPLPEELHMLLDLFAKYRVDMVITGHDHKQDEQVFGNTIHVVMDALKDGEKNAGYFQLKITDGVIGYSFINI